MKARVIACTLGALWLGLCACRRSEPPPPVAEIRLEGGLVTLTPGDASFRVAQTQHGLNISGQVDGYEGFVQALEGLQGSVGVRVLDTQETASLGIVLTEMVRGTGLNPSMAAGEGWIPLAPAFAPGQLPPLSTAQLDSERGLLHKPGDQVLTLPCAGPCGPGSAWPFAELRVPKGHTLHLAVDYELSWAQFEEAMVALSAALPNTPLAPTVSWVMTNVQGEEWEGPYLRVE